MNSPIKRFECDGCGEIHASEWSAEICCKPDVVEVWECSDCEEIHDSVEAAHACCGGGNQPPPASHVDLEAAGQINFLSGGAA
jgi:hypothetical protein